MANTARLPWPELWARLPLDNLPLGYVALKSWSAAFGESEFALRALSALCYATAVFFTGLTAGRIENTAAGIGAAMLMASSDRIGLEYAATVRSYALLSAIASVALWQTVRLIEEAAPASRPRIAALCATHVAGAFTHPTYVLLAAGFAFAAIFVRRKRAVVAVPLVAIAIYAIAWAPMVYATMRLSTTRWMQPPSPGDVYAAAALIWGLRPAAIVMALLVGVMVTRRTAVERFFSSAPARWGAAAALITWTLPLIVSVWKPVFEASRTPVMLLPATCVAIACVLARGGGTAVLAACVVVCATAATYRVSMRPRADPAPSRATLAALLSRTACGDVVIAPGVTATTAEYYFRRLDAPLCVRLVPFPRDVFDVFGDWSGRLRDPAVRSRLDAEADATAHAAAARRNAIWVLRLSTWETREATVMVETALQKVADCADPEPARGAFIDSVRRCQSR